MGVLVCLGRWIRGDRSSSHGFEFVDSRCTRPDDGVRSRPAHRGGPPRQGYPAGPARSGGRPWRRRAEAAPRRCRGKASADPRLPRRDRPGRRGAGDGRLGGVVHLGRRPGPGPGLRTSLDPAVHQSDVARGDRRQRPELAGSSRRSWRAWVSSSRSGPGTTTRSRWWRSCATTSGWRPT